MERVTLALLLLLVAMLVETSVVEALVTTADLETQTEQSVSMVRVQTLAGDTARLGCELRPPADDDKVTFVVWYRHQNETPIGTYDLRGSESRDDGAGQWPERRLGARASIHVVGAGGRPLEATLALDGVSTQDEGTYKCRVDFRRSPTRNSLVNLTVVETIREVVIVDWTGRVLRSGGGETEPLPEGASANITCMAYGGKPLARVSWWRDGALVDDGDVVQEDRRVTRNVLHVPRVLRTHLRATYTCEATNTVLRTPHTATVTIEMLLRPLDVKLSGASSPLSAGIRHDVICRTRGSRPPANITWWKDGILIDNADVTETLSTDGNETINTFGLVAREEDQGMTLSCRANNPRIPHSELRDTVMLHVLYIPKVTLTLGSKLNASNIREGADVYFECHIIANPWVHRVTWWHDARQLHNNVSAGVIVSNQTLVLQGVSRRAGGIYTCVGVNTQGDATSNRLLLDVKYEPVCGHNSRTVYGAARGEQVEVECSVDANPPASLFRWTFNHTPGAEKDLHAFSVEGGGRSLASYRPIDERDYGTLLCWGRNELGLQSRPCSFHIVPAGKPDPPHNCSVAERASRALRVVCRRGFDGGLAQRFTLLVALQTQPDHFVANVTSASQPDFQVSGLEPDTLYTALVFAYNEKGRSRTARPLLLRTLPQPLSADIKKPPAPTASPSSSATEMHPWVYIGMGVLVSLVVTALVLSLVLHWWYNESHYAAGTSCRCCRRSKRGPAIGSGSESSIKGCGEEVNAGDASISGAVMTPKKSSIHGPPITGLGPGVLGRLGSGDPLRAIVEDEEEKNPDLIPTDLYYRQLYSPNNLSYTISPCQVISYDGQLEVLPITAMTSTLSLFDEGTPVTHHTWHRENSLPLPSSTAIHGPSYGTQNPSRSDTVHQSMLKWGSDVQPFSSGNLDTVSMSCMPSTKPPLPLARRGSGLASGSLLGVCTNSGSATGAAETDAVLPLGMIPKGSDQYSSNSSVSKHHVETQTPLLRHKESSV